jgi:hypothetical protein
LSGALVLLGSAAWSQITAVEWGQDLEFLARELPARHKNAFFVLPREEFEKRTTALARRLPTLDALETEGELVSLVAALGDSHTRVEMRALLAGPRLPLSLHWFKDGLRVVAVPRQHGHAAGGLVTKIGSVDLEEVAKRMARIQHFDNESMRRSNLPNLVTLPKVLEFLDVVEDTETVPVTVVNDDKRETTIAVRPGRLGRDAVVMKPGKPPVTAPRSGKWHDFEILDEEGLLYIQYNKCATDRAHDLAGFTETVAGICAKGGVKTIVIDVQYNGGGASPLGDEMFARLAKEAPLKERKNVFCVIGRYTFSSAILNAMTLKKEYGAVLVGEPTGGSPNHFGEVTHFELPASKLKVHYSQKRFERAAPGTTTIEPDHRAEATFADYLAGRDVVLETIRNLVAAGAGR